VLQPEANLHVFRLQVVLLSEAYLTALIPSYKKRICHYCLEDHQKRLTVCCSELGLQLTAAVQPTRYAAVITKLILLCHDAERCNQAWYCSPQCQHAHWAGQAHATSEGLFSQSPASSNSHSSSSHFPPVPTSSSVCAHTRHVVPHSLTCAVLKRFSSIKCDPGMESVVRMCLDAMALQLLKTQAGEHFASDCTLWDNADQ